MPREAAARDWGAAAETFAALGDETRLHIVARLCAEGPLSITRLTDDAAMTRQAMTKHLQVLADAGLVDDARDGKQRVFTLRPGGLDAARRRLDAIAAEWDATLGRLRAFVEG